MAGRNTEQRAGKIITDDIRAFGQVRRHNELELAPQAARKDWQFTPKELLVMAIEELFEQQIEADPEFATAVKTSRRIDSPVEITIQDQRDPFKDMKRLFTLINNPNGCPGRMEQLTIKAPGSSQSDVTENDIMNTSFRIGITRYLPADGNSVHYSHLPAITVESSLAGKQLTGRTALEFAYRKLTPQQSAA